MAETIKAKARREREGWFEKFAPADRPGIDIGCGDDPIHESFRRFDRGLGDGDATTMEAVGDGQFFTVYTSHVLEHLDEPTRAVRSWYRILAPGGHLIICVPHRELYERKRELPSRWNDEHKHFWLPIRGEPPCTRGLLETILDAVLDANVVSLRVLDDGFHDPGAEHHALGEYSIEAIVRRPA